GRSAGADQRMLITVWVTWSWVEIIWALAWKFRCAVIMFTSCSVRSTLEASSAPPWTSPNSEETAVPTRGSPEAAVCAQALSPIDCRPCGFAKSVIATWPSGLDTPLVKRACSTPSAEISMPTRRPVAWPSCDSAETEKRSPYWLVLPRSRMTSAAAAPLLGSCGPRLMVAGAGATSLPVSEYFSVVAPPTGCPSMEAWTCHSLGLAVFTKWKVWVCAAPSESYTVSEVVWFQLSGSAASNGATAGTLALAGRLAPTPTLAVARGGASPVASCRSV